MSHRWLYSFSIKFYSLHEALNVVFIIIKLLCNIVPPTVQLKNINPRHHHNNGEVIESRGFSDLVIEETTAELIPLWNHPGSHNK